MPEMLDIKLYNEYDILLEQEYGEYEFKYFITFFVDEMLRTFNNELFIINEIIFNNLFIEINYKFEHGTRKMVVHKVR